jgi:protein-tyrosine phosphatase
VFRAALEERDIASVNVESAGWVPGGRPSPPQAVREAARRGVDLSSHRSRLVTNLAIQRAGLTIVMSPDQARTVRRVSGINPLRVVLLGDLDPEAIHGRTIVDPMGGPDSLFVESFDRLERCVRELVALFVSGMSSSIPQPDRRLPNSAARS